MDGDVHLGRAPFVRARAQTIADHLLEPSDRRLGSGSQRVAGRPLPGYAPVLIRNWVVQADRQEGLREDKGDSLRTAEREELARLRRENKQLRVERDILSRAAAWFARETGAVPSGSLGSMRP